MVRVIPSASLCQDMGSQVLAGLIGRAGPQAVGKIMGKICACEDHWEREHWWSALPLKVFCMEWLQSIPWSFLFVLEYLESEGSHKDDQVQIITKC